jgi:hypothetical protein
MGRGDSGSLARRANERFLSRKSKGGRISDDPALAAGGVVRAPEDVGIFGRQVPEHLTGDPSGQRRSSTPRPGDPEQRKIAEYGADLSSGEPLLDIAESVRVSK